MRKFLTESIFCFIYQPFKLKIHTKVSLQGLKHCLNTSNTTPKQLWSTALFFCPLEKKMAFSDSWSWKLGRGGAMNKNPPKRTLPPKNPPYDIFSYRWYHTNPPPANSPPPFLADFGNSSNIGFQLKTKKTRYHANSPPPCLWGKNAPGGGELAWYHR